MTRADTFHLLAIGPAGLVLRVAYALQYAAHPLGRLPWVDEGAYWTRAFEIRAGSWLPDHPFHQDPLFPAALTSVVGPGIASLRVALACSGAPTSMAISTGDFKHLRRGRDRS